MTPPNFLWDVLLKVIYVEMALRKQLCDCERYSGKSIKFFRVLEVGSKSDHIILLKIRYHQDQLDPVETTLFIGVEMKYYF